MIDVIRSYFKGVIQAVNPDLKEHKEYFTSENVDQLQLEDKYFLNFGVFSSQLIDTSYIGQLAVELEIWKNGKEDLINRLDSGYCEAIEIFTRLQDQKAIAQVSFMKAVVGSQIEPEAVEDNENCAKYTLSFTVTVGY